MSLLRSKNRVFGQSVGVLYLILLPRVLSLLPHSIVQDISQNYCTLLLTSFKFEGMDNGEGKHSHTFFQKDSHFYDSPRVNLHLPSFKFPREDTSRHWRAPLRILSHSNCVYVILPLPFNFNQKVEELIEKLVTAPILAPQAVKNRDKFLIFSRDSVVQTLSESRVIKSLKYKLVVTHKHYMKEGGSFRMFQFCTHCVFPVREIHASFRPGLDRLFPDLEKNFHGKVLKMSTSDKVRDDIYSFRAKVENL